MQFSDTTNKNGIVQTIEFWTNLGDAGISSNPTLLKVITSRVNEAFDRLMPLLLSYSDYPRWDDINHTDLPVAKFNLVSGQSNYSFTEDDNNLDVLNITGVRVLQSASAAEYLTLKRMTLDDERAADAIDPNPSVSGIPTHFLERGNVIFLYPEPNYSATNGIKALFEREQSYFASTDTTKEPGIPKPFHGLLPLYAAHDWLIVNKPGDGTLITRVEGEIAKREQHLKDLISTRNPTVSRVRTSVHDTR